MQSSSGVGLAAPQCGIPKQVIIVLMNAEPKVLINPEIIFTSEEKVTEEEGCLSFNGQFYPISRAKEVTVKYKNLSGHPIRESHTGLVARILQHEIDHLHGIVFKSYLDT
jgi:peptide deformylase